MAKRKSTKQTHRIRNLLILLVLIGIGLVFLLKTGAIPPEILKLLPPEIQEIIEILTPKPTPAPEPRELPPPTPASPTPISSPGEDWWQVYFTDPNTMGIPDDPEHTVPAGSIEEHLIKHISQAQESIHVAAFEFNLTPVAEALIEAHKRGVKVQWVTDDEHGLEADEEEGHGQFAMLKGAGIEVKDDGRGALMHNKFWVFDNKAVWTGSTNITSNGMFRNNNNVIVIESLDLAKIYEREFAEMWAGEFGPRSPSTVDNQAVTIGDTSIQVYFAAEDDVIEKLIPLVGRAQHSVRVMAFSFTHDTLGQAVLARAQAGADMQAIFETTGSETQYSELSLLYCAGFPVRQDGNKGIFHHKVLILDDTVVTGSLNFSDSADEKNDENVLIITHPDIAALYRQEFERRWTEASDPDAADLGCPERQQTSSVTPPPTDAPETQTDTPPAECLIKGNIMSSGEKVYYMPEDSGYGSVKIDESKGERWFCSEQEAQDAGWKRKE